VGPFRLGYNPVMDTVPLNAVLIERRDIHEGLSIVRVRPDAGQVPEFKAGQYITLGLPRAAPASSVAVAPGPATSATPRPIAPRLVRRAYSIASSPQVRDSMEFYVVLVQAGLLTPRLWTVEEGGRLWMDDKAKGEFTLDSVSPEKDLVLVSTGTGIAPHMSMLRMYCGQARWRRCVVINGVREARDLGYGAELEAIARDNPGIVYIPIVSREPVGSAWQGLRGRVQDALEQGVYRRLVGAPLDPKECHVYLCGNPAMIASVRQVLQERGFTPHSRHSPGNIHFERYW
jgi:ferredoxin--NADP+ reductase